MPGHNNVLTFQSKDSRQRAGMERASFITSMKICASSPGRQRRVPPSSLLERMALIREGSSRGVNLLLIRHLQAEVLKSSDKNHRVLSIPYKIGKDRVEGIPLSNTGVMALEACSPTSRFSSGDKFNALRVPSIRRISAMWPSTSPLLCLVCDALAFLLRFRPILRIILEKLFGMVSGWGQDNCQHTSSNPPLPS